MNTDEPLSPADRALPVARDPLIHYVPVLALLCAITLSLYYHRWLRYAYTTQFIKQSSILIELEWSCVASVALRVQNRRGLQP